MPKPFKISFNAHLSLFSHLLRQFINSQKKKPEILKEFMRFLKKLVNKEIFILTLIVMADKLHLK